MKKVLYPRLAVDCIKKNSRLYTPYILTCIGMVMMFYILMGLATSSRLGLIRGGTSALPMVLSLGSFVMAVFSLLFLFYTNSFLVRRRNKEFGLYNILGMGKRNIARLLAWETMIIAVISIAGGILLGVLFSKVAELALLMMLDLPVDFTFEISQNAVLYSLVLYAAIFLLLFLNSVWKLHITNPIQLMNSDNLGEKPPKANWLLGILGVIILGVAYYLACSIEEPLQALALFFVAVIMVIIGTYMIFISGSVVFCRILQKNKKYYYKPQHFASVSSMVFRMNRNGAGLASICILATMVLVMISSTTCLYYGTESSLRSRYPRNIILTMGFDDIDQLHSGTLDSVREEIKAVSDAGGVQTENVLDYVSASYSAYYSNGSISTEKYAEDNGVDFYKDKRIVQLSLISLDDYNKNMNTDYTLGENEVMLYSYRLNSSPDTVSINGSEAHKVVKVLDATFITDEAAMNIVPTLTIVTNDFDDDVKPILETAQMSALSWHYGFDTELKDEAQSTLCRKLAEDLSEQKLEYAYYMSDCIADNRADFYASNGGLFFIGIMLSIVLTFAAVLIIYYKQLSEGYEDKRRFKIMQNVGMSLRDIRRSINSQLLTVFFLPLLFAGLHLTFAFPFVQKLLMLFNLNDVSLLIGTTAISFLIFAVLYTVIYRVTSNAYYSIVSSSTED